MNTLLVFMVASLIFGLWTKPRVRSGAVFLAVAAVVLVLYFWIRPSQL